MNDLSRDPAYAAIREELRADLEFAYANIPGRHRLNLHACYMDTDESPDRDEIETTAATIDEAIAETQAALEANPDDLDRDHMAALLQSGVNRLSLGIQSFRDEELQWMNRAHTARQAHKVLEAVAGTFENYSIDLIYGIPGSSLETWEQTLQTALGYAPPHLDQRRQRRIPKGVVRLQHRAIENRAAGKPG